MPGGFDWFNLFDDLPSLIIFVLLMIVLVVGGFGLAHWILLSVAYGSFS